MNIYKICESKYSLLIVAVFCLVLVQCTNDERNIDVTWTRTNLYGVPGPLGNIAYSDGYLYVSASCASGTGNLYMSSDQGNNWMSIANKLPAFRTVQSLSAYGSRAFVGFTLLSGVSRLYRSTDYGVSWVSVNNNMNASVSDIIITDAYVLIATNKGIYRSTDNGDSWTKLDGLSDISIRSLLVRDTEIIAATNEGVYRSTDNGANWVIINNGLPSQTIVWQVISIGTTLYASPQHNGLYRSTNNGMKWERVDMKAMENNTIRNLLVVDSKLFVTIYGDLYVSDESGADWKNLSPQDYQIGITSLVFTGNQFFAGVGIDGVWSCTWD